jgi:hypothetical protein
LDGIEAIAMSGTLQRCGTAAGRPQQRTGAESAGAAARQVRDPGGGAQTPVDRAVSLKVV